MTFRFGWHWSEWHCYRLSLRDEVKRECASCYVLGPLTIAIYKHVGLLRSVTKWPKDTHAAAREKEGE